MVFKETPLGGAFLIEPQRVLDDRGFFARTFCREEFIRRGLCPEVSQCNISFNARRHTLRGMHYQAAPHAEDKLVRVTRGAILDVIVDLRPGSPTYSRWYGVEITAANRLALYVPRGMAHGFLTLEDETEVFYQMSTPFAPGAGRGVRWNDPAFGIEWPVAEPFMSGRDAGYGDFRP